jgi:hypothetical protein
MVFLRRNFWAFFACSALSAALFLISGCSVATTFKNYEEEQALEVGCDCPNIKVDKDFERIKVATGTVYNPLDPNSKENIMNNSAVTIFATEKINQCLSRTNLFAPKLDGKGNAIPPHKGNGYQIIAKIDYFGIENRSSKINVDEEGILKSSGAHSFLDKCKILSLCCNISLELHNRVNKHSCEYILSSYGEAKFSSTYEELTAASGDRTGSASGEVNFITDLTKNKVLRLAIQRAVKNLVKGIERRDII